MLSNIILHFFNKLYYYIRTFFDVESVEIQSQIYLILSLKSLEETGQSATTREEQPCREFVRTKIPIMNPIYSNQVHFWGRFASFVRKFRTLCR